MTAKDFFLCFFAELDAKDIQHVILHSYDKLPDSVTSDVDYAVRSEDIEPVHRVLRGVAEQLGWLVVQTLQHEVHAFYSVAINPADVRQFVKLDLCSDFMKEGHSFIPASVLLEGRRQVNGFWVPSLSSEFGYLLAKALGKRKDLREIIPRLRELWDGAPDGAALRLRELLGPKFDSFAALESVAGEGATLRQQMRDLHKPGSRLRFQEFKRVLSRVIHPTGLYLAVLGSDGVGKSTLLEYMEAWLKPCFRAEQRFHFRPHLFQRKKSMSVDQPHAQPPRGTLASWVKVFYYFADHLFGYWFAQFPRLLQSTCIIFDRHFDDLLVDSKRYRLRKCKALVFALRWLLPKPDITFVLDASPEVIHARKPELSVDEIRRQRTVLRQLAAVDARYFVVSAEDPAERVAQAVCRQSVVFLAARFSERNP